MKFKPYDFVEVLPGNFTGKNLKAGMVGVIICYDGDYNHPAGWAVLNSYTVNFPEDYVAHITECRLKLIPGDPDAKSSGSWDECPWTPYKRNVEA